MNIEFNRDTRTVLIDDVRIPLDALQEIARPDPRRYYRFRRVGGSVILQSFSTVELLKSFAEDYARATTGEGDRARPRVVV
jgi:hypothetical protein